MLSVLVCGRSADVLVEDAEELPHVNQQVPAKKTNYEGCKHNKKK